MRHPLVSIEIPIRNTTLHLNRERQVVRKNEYSLENDIDANAELRRC